MKFEWGILQNEMDDGHGGVASLLKRMDSSLKGEGLPLEGFEFLNSTQEMLRITREIEDAALVAGPNSTVYVGFQNIDKLQNIKETIESCQICQDLQFKEELANNDRLPIEIFLAKDSIIPIVCSAADTVFISGVFITIIPFLVAAEISILSTPTPARPITCNFTAA